MISAVVLGFATGLFILSLTVRGPKIARALFAAGVLLGIVGIWFLAPEIPTT